LKIKKNRLERNEGQELTRTSLVQVVVDDVDWKVLHRNPTTGEYWKEFFPQSKMHGGGPPVFVKMWQPIAGRVPRYLFETVSKQLLATNGPANAGSAFAYYPNAPSFVRRWPGGGRTTADRSARGRPTSSVVLANLANSFLDLSPEIHCETS
jgi:hypothetical protein